MPKTTTPPSPSSLWNRNPVDNILAVNNDHARSLISRARLMARTALDQALQDLQLNSLIVNALQIALLFGRGSSVAFVNDGRVPAHVQEFADNMSDNEWRSDRLSLDDFMDLAAIIPDAIEYAAQTYQMTRGEFLQLVADQTEQTKGLVIRRAAFAIKLSVHMIGVFVGIPDRETVFGGYSDETEDHGVNAEAATAFAMGLELGKASTDADEGAVELQGMDREQSQDADDTVGTWKAGETVAMDGVEYVSRGAYQIHGRDALDAIPCHCTADDCDDCHPDQDTDCDPSSVRQDAPLTAPAAGSHVGATTGYHLTRNEWPDGTVEVTLNVQVVKGTEWDILRRMGEVGASIL